MAMSRINAVGRRGRRAPMAEINVTPMVDVMLVLLIIFMVAAPLLATGVEVNMPESKAAPLDQQQPPVTISLTQRGQIFVDMVEVSAGELDRRLGEIARASTDGGPRIFLRADRNLDYGRVMQLMGDINAAGLTKVSLVSNPET